MNKEIKDLIENKENFKEIKFNYNKLTKIFINHLIDLIDLTDFLLISDIERKQVKSLFQEIKDILVKYNIIDMVKYLNKNFSKDTIKEIKDLL